MSNPTLIKSRTASGVIAPYRIVAHSAGGTVSQAATNADKFDGVSGQLGADAAGDRVDVSKTGIEHVEFGGSVDAGDPLTADAQGRAILAAPAAGATVTVIGNAEHDAVAGDVGEVSISISRFTGA